MRYLPVISSAAIACAAIALGVTIGGSTADVQAQTAEQAGHASIYTPDKLPWKDGPPSVPPGAQFVVLEGDLSAKGEYFALRLSVPDGYEIPPHWHPVFERVTVISGTFHLGHGKTVDPKATRALRAGSYFTMPPKTVHFARAQGPTVVQLTSIGPWEIQYVNPDDDPRKRK